MQANPTIQVLLDWLLSMEQKNYRRYAKSYKKITKKCIVFHHYGRLEKHFFLMKTSFLNNVFNSHF